jgi:hypothetical protein
MATTYRVPEGSIVHEVIDRELILINLLTGTYYSANESGAFLWKLLLQGASQAELVGLAATRFGVPADTMGQQVQAFLEHLKKEELIVESEAPAGAPAPPPAGATSAYQPPRLIVFSDMQELLVLDPIHEVNEHGWPHLPKADG